MRNILPLVRWQQSFSEGSILQYPYFAWGFGSRVVYRNSDESAILTLEIFLVQFWP